MNQEQLLEECPGLVPNVETSRQTTRDGKPYLVICNPAANTYLKLNPEEYALLPLMDGTRTVSDLVMAYFQFHGVLAPPRVIGFVDLLRARHFLIEPRHDADSEFAARTRQMDVGVLVARIARGFVHSEFPLKNIDARLDQLYRAIGWIFFTRPGLFVGASLAILGPILYLLQLGHARYLPLDLGGSYLAQLPVLMLLLCVMLLPHELGHAMAVKYAGRHVTRGGLMLYYGFLAGYVETSDIWMAPRRQRLIVSLAGPYMDLVGCGVCAVAALLLSPGGLREGLFTWGFFLLIGTLFNFNPLLELDGYYLLIDWLEKPLLRARALAFFRAELWKRLRSRQSLTCEESFLALFGFASAAYSGIALLLAVKFWELRVARLVSEALGNGNLLTQTGALILLALISMPLLLALMGLARRLSKNVINGLTLSKEIAATQLRDKALKPLPETSVSRVGDCCAHAGLAMTVAEK